ncbi:hypothetical protein [uncultured Oxalicibacterium sp.]|uniref:hypothetical protein n=1 Tax=uncultured Oxalicibacterium sp. TaxID=1168540 RepID=UPI0025D58774|nr:hypothetical protein [uncultured Oxalicibacterium sp.]
MPALLLVLVLLGFATPSWAVYKCSSSKGTVYSDVPCSPDNQDMQRLTVNPPPADDAAHERAAHEKKQLHALEKQRAQDQAIEQRARAKAHKTETARKQKCADMALRAKWAREDANRAPMRNARSAEQAERKARRLEERHALHCQA